MAALYLYDFFWRPTYWLAHVLQVSLGWAARSFFSMSETDTKTDTKRVKTGMS
jgi:hypothetical protein